MRSEERNARGASASFNIFNDNNSALLKNLSSSGSAFSLGIYVAMSCCLGAFQEAQVVRIRLPMREM